MNLSHFSIADTAITSLPCARQRAQNASILGGREVLELCVGPSLERLAASYAEYRIKCWGNDIDPRWKAHYPQGKWLMGDAFDVFRAHHKKFNFVVYAPPLTHGCSGSREDSLSINEVYPSYSTFIDLVMEVKFNGCVALVLPGRSWSTKVDRKQYFELKSKALKHFVIDEAALVDGCRKYVDLYLVFRRGNC